MAASTTALAGEGVARADEREQCASAADQAQQLRDEGKYRRAREQLIICARDACPAPIKRDCLEWLSQIESTAPTVVFGAKEGTKDLSDVKVSVDGVAVTDSLDGKPVQMDLGKHTVKFEYRGQTKEEDIIVGAGQKNRNVTMTFTRRGARGPHGPGGPAPSEGGGARSSLRSSSAASVSWRSAASRSSVSAGRATSAISRRPASRTARRATSTRPRRSSSSPTSPWASASSRWAWRRTSSSLARRSKRT